ncbi:MAG: xanthine dehydrogenase family protein subunit M [Pseudomonadota bacterium]
MKPRDFTYHRAESLEAALALMADDDAMALAGGQSLMPVMNFRLSSPEALVDLNGLTSLAGVHYEDRHLWIGAMTRYADLEASAEVAQHAPLIAMALPHIAHPAIRNRGTIGGSCALADPAAEIPALLLALDAKIHLQSATGARVVAADDFFKGLYETARADDELVVAIQIPVQEAGQRHGFYEVARRHGDYAMVGCAIVAASDLSKVRVALFAISDRPVRAKGAETALAVGPGEDPDVASAIAALGDLDFVGDMNAGADTKRHLAGVALRRAWADLMA